MTIDFPVDSQIPALRRLWKQAFGDTEAFLDDFFRAGFSPDRCLCIQTEGTVAAALYWFDCTWQGKKVAYLYAVATDTAFQGKGLCRKLMEHTHRHLQENGYAGAVLVPGNPGLFDLYGKLGYVGFCPMERITVAAGTPKVTVEAVNSQAYDRLRRQRLPENAIEQDGLTTAFLSCFAGLYQTDGGVFSAAKEENTLYFQEFLGNRRELPGIIAALGAEKGVVSLPGRGKNTAMYLPLNNIPFLPDYLGLSLI